MVIQIEIGTIGADADNFNIYSNYAGAGTWTLVDSGVSRNDLLAPGYELNVPDGTTQVKVESTGVCDNSIVIDVNEGTTTTTTSTSTSTSSTTTTSTTCHGNPVCVKLGTSTGTICSETPEIIYVPNSSRISTSTNVYTDQCLTTLVSNSYTYIAFGGSGTIFELLNANIESVVIDTSCASFECTTTTTTTTTVA